MANYIQARTDYHAVGDRYYPVLTDVVWDGVDAQIHSALLDNIPHSGNLYEIGPYIARLIPESRDVVSDSYTLVKVDHPFAWLHVAKWHIGQWWEPVNWRLIYTLAIWGLAKMPKAGERIGWYLVKDRWTR